MLSENMASLGGENLLIAKDNLDESNTIQEHHQHQQNDMPPVPIKRVKDRDERLRQIKDRQNEERQKKLEELKAQAFAAQKYREQKEDERRRRIDDLRCKENDKRQQVEDRKKAILDAEKERREYIVRKNLERDSRLDTKRRNERSSIGFAFGSSTPRLLDPVDVGALSSGNFWGHRRSTSITNVAYNGGAQISRRSSERELSDAPKKRAISAGGLDRQNEDRGRKGARNLMCTSMYEVFNWGNSSSNDDAPPKRYPLTIAAGSDINIDDEQPLQLPQPPPPPPPPSQFITNPKSSNSSKSKESHNMYNNCKRLIDDITTDSSSPIIYRSVARRKTDLMPTIPSPREPSFGSRASLYCSTPRTPGRTVSMTRLDQLAQPTRCKGEHIRAVIERQRQMEFDDAMYLSSNNNHNILSPRSNTSTTNNSRSMSRSLTHLAATTGSNNKHTSGNKIYKKDGMRQLRKGDDASKSMTHLSGNATTTATTTTTTTTIKSSATTGAAPLTKRYSKNLSRQRHHQPPPPQPRNHQSDHDDETDEPNSLSVTGSRSGEVTPGGSVISRPGSALSSANSTASGVIRRANPLVRRPRPASIAGTGMSSSIAITGVTNDAMHEINKQIQQHKKDRPPIPIPRAQNIHRKTLSTTNVNQNNGSLTTSKTMTTSTITVAVTSNTDSNLPPKRPERRSQPQTYKKKITSPLQPSPKTDTNKLIKDIINTNEKIETIKNDVLPIVVNDNNNNNNNNINDSNSNNSINNETKTNAEILIMDSQQQQQHINENSIVENIESVISTVTADHPIYDNTNEIISNINQEFINNEKNLTNKPEQISTTTTTTTTTITKIQKDNSDNIMNDVEHELESINSNISEINNSVVNNGIIAAATTAVAGSVAAAAATVGAAADSKEKTLDVHDIVDMSASMMAKRITTEEEAKAALAERRRLAREEAERQAELERQRVEAEEIAEQQRIVEEEERQRRFEEETLRLAAEQRISEEQRLLQAIEEAKQREEEERQRREEDERLRLEREESDRKTREDLEKQKIEVAERLKKEEEERNERRKRVEAIMKRTRTSGSAGTPGNTSMATPNKNDEKDSPVEKDGEQSLIINDNNNTVNIDNIDNNINDNNNNENNNDDNNNNNNNIDINIDNNNNNNQTTITQVTIVEATNQKDAFNEYEKSVMDKEISLMSQFSNLIEKNNFQNSDNNNPFKSSIINGNIEVDLSKAIDEKLIINNNNNTHHNNNNNHNNHNNNNSAISNGNGHTTDSLDNNNIESTTTTVITTTTTVTPSNIINNNNLIDIIDNNNVMVTDHVTATGGQLIDFNLDSTNQTININNNNNNNSLQQITASLVTSDSQDNRDISLL